MRRASYSGSMRVAIAAALVAAFVALVPAAHSAGPQVSYTIRAGAVAGTNGWYRSNVIVDLQFSPEVTSTTCPAIKTFATSSDAIDCTATDGTAIVQFNLQFKIDKDAPTVSGASPSRSANGNGWYNAPLSVSFAGTDATSGTASCQQVSY